ncbi:MAG TPA: hypothetical protein VFO82_10700 [Steroidobacteraceae bacterium]|nr:hypothetical protein [Steroidobacteraceae bacterium]
MDGFDNFFFLLVLGAVLLLSHLIQNAAKREARVQKPAQASEEEQSQDDAGESEQAEARPRRMKPRFVSGAGRMPGMQRADVPSPVRIPARHLVTGRENLRRAVIAMTVLGPPVSERPRSAPPGGVPE